jgi:hypothetical protein
VAVAEGVAACVAVGVAALEVLADAAAAPGVAEALFTAASAVVTAGVVPW